MPRAESSPVEDRGDAVAIIERLHRAGWSIGDVPLRGEGGGLVWIVLGRRGAATGPRGGAGGLALR